MTRVLMRSAGAERCVAGVEISLMEMAQLHRVVQFEASDQFRQTMKLLTYLKQKFVNGIDYSDAVKLCLGFYVAKNLIPKAIEEEDCSMEGLSVAFSELAKSNIIKNYVNYKAVEYGANYHNVTDKGHWVEVMASIFKKGNEPDLQLVAKLLDREPRSR